jgi:CBS domain containing-hemolysin-like protein
MKLKIYISFSFLILLSILGLLIVALTDLIPDNPFREHAFIIGLAFMVFMWFFRWGYGKMK